MLKKSSLPGTKILKKEEKGGEKKLQNRAKAEKNIFLLYKPQGLFAFCHWKFWTFLEFPDFLDILKKEKSLMFNSRIISDHLCFCFLWVICVLWKLRNSVFFLLPPVGGDTQWTAFPLCGKNGTGEPEKLRVYWHFLLLLLKLRQSRERKIFSLPSPRKGHSFWSRHTPTHGVDLSPSRLQPL